MGEQAEHLREAELRALMTEGLAGDATAHKTLLKTLSGHLRAYFKSRLVRVGLGPVEAEDLVQETLIAIHTRRHTYDPSKLFTPWVYAIARYKLIDHLRGIKGSISDLPLEEAGEITAHDDGRGIESGVDVHKLMSQLPGKMREAIQLVKLDELSISEAAKRSGQSESAVKMSVHRGLKALAQSIRRGGDHEDR
jgi:RNA polymerase sigma-70 factor (ECF subfamily)